MNNNRYFPIIEYLHLDQIVLTEPQEDYIEQFLPDTKSSLPYNVHLSVDYRPLKTAINNFTRAPGDPIRSVDLTVFNRIRVGFHRKPASFIKNRSDPTWFLSDSYRSESGPDFIGI
jgi:hypothetical protein